jgi:hypothetical protein
MNSLRSILCVTVFASVASLSSAATVINVDFNLTGGSTGTYSGQGAVVDTGNNLWNGFNAGSPISTLIASATSGALLTSTGASSGGVTVTVGNFRPYEAAGGVAVANGLFNDFLYQQNLGPGGPNSTFSINNLSPASTYDLYFYAQNAAPQNTATTFTIGATTLIATNAGPVPPNPVTTSFVLGVNYIRFLGVTPNGSGVISGTFNDFAAANNAAFNGMQIVQVPEPSSLLPLAGLAGLLLPRRRA